MSALRAVCGPRSIWLLLPLLAPAVWAQAPQYCLEPETAVHRSPDPASEVIGTLARGDEVRVRGEQGVWRRVSAARVSAPGWVPSWRISPTPPDGKGDLSVVTTTPDVNVRQEASAESGLVAILPRGTGLTVLSSRGEWRQVRIAGSKLAGWVPSWAVEPGAAPARQAAAPEVVAAPDRGQMRYINGDNVYLRKGPSIETEPSAILAKSTVVYPVDVAGEWVRVRIHEGPEGWVCRVYLSEKPDLAPAGSYLVGPEPTSRPEIPQNSDELRDNEGMVYQETASVRSGSSSEFPAIATMPAGVVFQITGEANGWYQALFPDGTRGWIASWMCVANRMPEDLPSMFQQIPTEPEPTAPAPQVSQYGAYLTRLAMGQIGKPYIWGAESPSVGFDCSGLLYWCHRQIGIQLPRTTFGQWKVGRLIQPQDLQPGDCIYFHRSSRGPEHCGMYVGNGWFIHAPGRGKRVRYQRLIERARDYVCARRMY